MYETDKNMLNAIDMLKEFGDIRFKREAYEVMNIPESTVQRIKNQEKYDQSLHFTPEQIRVFCNHFGVNSNYIFGFESKFYRGSSSVPHRVTENKIRL